MKIKLKDIKNDKTYQVEKGDTFIGPAREYQEETGRTVFAVKLNNNIREVFKEAHNDGEIEFIDIKSPDGVKINRRGLFFILHAAIKDIDKDNDLLVNNSLGNGIYCELKKGIPTENDLKHIKEIMKKYIEDDLEFQKYNIDKFEAMKMFEAHNQHDKSLLFKYRKKTTVNFYKVNGYINYFYGYMPLKTSDLTDFDLIKVDKGFVLVTPNEKSPSRVPKYKHLNKLSATFNEYNEWLKILEIRTVGELNDYISKGKHSAIELIRISEALHEKKYAKIADDIIKRRNVRLITLAGPSSSGKTTSSKRISLQLRVNGLRPVEISLDDFFVERDKTPLDEYGNYDFESLYALDLDLFNNILTDLIKGKEVRLPKFNFVTGKREWRKNRIQITEDQPIIVEGIHGLNEKLTQSISRDKKYKVYVSALTQLNIDRVNRIPTTDSRIIRRIVRDFNFRGHDALATIKMWPSVRRGEEHNIFPYQEEADVMFNSNLIYELSILKIFAEPLLLKIDNSVPEYSEAKRLLKFLDYFLPITELEEIPRKSVIREFIGRSTFEY